MRQQEATKANPKVKGASFRDYGSDMPAAKLDSIYAAMVNLADDGLVIIIDGIFVFVNSTFARMTGYDTTGLMGQSYLKVIAPRWQKLVRREYESKISERRSASNYRIELVGRNNQTVPVEVRLGKVNHNGTRADMVIVRNITEHKRMEQEIQERNRQLDAQNEELKTRLDELAKSRAFSEGLLKSMIDGFCVFDLEGRLIDINEALLKMTGFKKEEIIGLQFEQIIAQLTAPAEAEKMSAGIKRFMAGEPVGIIRMLITNKGGNQLTISIANSVVKDNKGIPTMWFAVIRDVTEQEQAEEKIQAQYQEIEVYSHELEAANDELQASQEKLLAANRALTVSQEELSTPVIQVWDKILALPVIGLVDSNRAQTIMDVLLSRIVETQAEMVILDITGVSTVDTQVANHLIKTVEAANMLGTECVITGIRPETAQTMIRLGLEMDSFPTKRTLRDGLMFGLKKLGFEVKRAAR
ncbi:MAG: PAS domain S-box protein [Dehalococcoidia bacterium]|nr:PAS domain S-box protein [Dehalococcoidia bacterium]